MKRILISLFIISMFFISCMKRVKETKIDNKNSKKRMVIFSDESEFKKELRDKIVKNYKKSCSIEIKNLSKINSIKIEDYSVIVLMDSLWAWEKFNRNVMKFAKMHKDNKKVVVFMSAGDPDYKFSIKKLDAISAATDKVSVNEIYNKMIKRIDKALFNKIKSKKIKNKKVKVDTKTKASGKYKK